MSDGKRDQGVKMNMKLQIKLHIQPLRKVRFLKH